MYKTVYKYPFKTKGQFGVYMPKGAEILCVQMQGDSPCIWAKVDPERELEQRVFHVYGTGHSFSELSFKLNYIGTYQEMSGALVFHLFEETYP